MKTIYAKDLKNITKKFNLSEDEQYHLSDLAAQINAERSEICTDLQEVLLYGSRSNDRCNAVSALLLYFGAKLQNDNALRCARDRTCWVLASLLHCGSYQVMLWFRGLARLQDRFGSRLKYFDTFGPNYLEFSL